MPKAFRWSDLFLAAFGFSLMAAYWPGISGAATTPRWDVAVLIMLPWLFLPEPRITAAKVTGAALFGWLMLSLAWSAGRLDGLDSLVKLAIAAAAFGVGSRIDRIGPFFTGAALGLAISSAVAVAQANGWHGVASIDDTPAGLFVNRDRLAAAAALVVIGCAAIRQWRLGALVLPGFLIANSRAAFLAVAVGLFFIPSDRKVRAVIYAIGVAGVLIVLAVRGVDLAVSERFWIWQDTWSGVTVFGHGLGSFREAYPDYLAAYAKSWAATGEPTRPEHPHNELLWLLFEGGYPALVLGLVFGACCFAASRHPVRSVLAGVFVLAQFAMPLHDPATLLATAVVAGQLVGRRRLLRDLHLSCRDPLCEGMAAYERGVIGKRDRDGRLALSA